MTDLLACNHLFLQQLPCAHLDSPILLFTLR